MKETRKFNRSKLEFLNISTTSYDENEDHEAAVVARITEEHMIDGRPGKRR